MFYQKQRVLWNISTLPLLCVQCLKWYGRLRRIRALFCLNSSRLSPTWRGFNQRSYLRGCSDSKYDVYVRLLSSCTAAPSQKVPHCNDATVRSANVDIYSSVLPRYSSRKSDRMIGFITNAHLNAKQKGKLSRWYSYAVIVCEALFLSGTFSLRGPKAGVWPMHLKLLNWS